MGTKMAVTFSVIFMAHLEKRLFTASPLKPFAWKRFIDNIFFLWNIPMEEVSIFVNFANSFGSTPWSNLLVKSHPSPLFFLTPAYSKDIAVQLLWNHPVQAQLNTHISSCHPYNTNFNAKEAFIKGEALRLCEPTHARRILINTNGNFEQRERLFHAARS